MSDIKFILNNKEVCYKGSASNRLLDVLRDEYHLTGVKCGCKEGECGACAVIMDGLLVNSCMVAMGRADGSTIMTIEGFRETERFSVIEKAFAELSSVQCGFCIPGMVLAAEALLSKNPSPTEDEIREGVSGNLCRCTGYNALVKAISIAAKEGKGLW
jgi:carbon-monoxide dehydrogenase small subunit